MRWKRGVIMKNNKGKKVGTLTNQYTLALLIKAIEKKI